MMVRIFYWAEAKAMEKERRESECVGWVSEYKETMNWDDGEKCVDLG